MLIAPQDHVIVKIHYEGRIGKSTLILPDAIGIQQNHEDFHGEVIAVDAKNVLGLKVGATVAFRRNEGHKFVDEQGRELISLKTKWVEAILED